jgi:hypothetical protein
MHSWRNLRLAANVEAVLRPLKYQSTAAIWVTCGYQLETLA